MQTKATATKTGGKMWEKCLQATKSRVEKPKKISILTKAARSENKTAKQVRPRLPPAPEQLHAGNLTPGWGENAPKHRGKYSNSNTSKRRKKMKKKEKKQREVGEEGGRLKRPKKKYACWKCTHRAGVKCGEKNGNMAQNTVWRCEPCL